MRIILKRDVKNLGKKDQVIEVSDGYARNYLIPKGMAEEANRANINIANIRNEAEKSRKERELAHAKALAEKLKSATLTIKAKAGENGKLFGSITAKDISERLKEDFSMDIDRKKINLPGVLKTIGTTDVEIKLYPQVSVNLSVRIVPE